ncbi:MAG: isoleucine--tRNA ligase [Clostridiales bacterium]|nr:isoleucine--tRNA ligase [Clostridiales bacterium]
MDYRQTVLLPKTDFPMRARLPEREPAFLEAWDRMDLYRTLRQQRQGKKKWVLHDGPPYTSGSAHVGTAMNKVLKDMIVRYHSLEGEDAPYVPGWDTHGLPTEMRALQQLGVNHRYAEALEIVRLCREFSLRNMEIMTQQFKRLGVLGDWQNPYRTLDPAFEGDQVEIFALMLEKGYVYRGLRPVYWCPTCVTALAEAEIEYQEKESPSLWAGFPVEDGKGFLPAGTWLLIWTTTPWTIPGNQAIAIHPEATYVLVETQRGPVVVAEKRQGEVFSLLGLEEKELLKTFNGRELEGITYRHPLYERVSPLILGEHVTVDDGTGLVHTAPGHGHEDFEVGERYHLPVTVPVDEEGRFTREAGPFEGLAVDEAAEKIVAALREKGALFLATTLRHSYPHCWRCHNPVIYRATEQWFVKLDLFREKAIQAAYEVKWVPSWGAQRMEEMVRGRTDWVLSRQRVWGVPIPAFYCRSCGEALATPEIARHVADLFRREGSEIWWREASANLLPEGARCPKCGSSDLEKGRDTFDVWMDSGSTHHAVLKRRPELHWPADLYLEGHNDQFRGWYQSSLLISTITDGKAPYREVLSHGFVVDAQGRHMHKSLGNTVDPMEVVQKFGADVFRLWVASIDYTADVRIGDAILEQVAEAYRKIRNTFRFFLGNLFDFSPEKDLVDPSLWPPLERWIVSKAAFLEEQVRLWAKHYQFRNLYGALYQFIHRELSSYYLDIRKDALYTLAPSDPVRRSAQSALYWLGRFLMAAFSPILVFTSEEVWQHWPKKPGEDEGSIHLLTWPELPLPAGLEPGMERLFWLREELGETLEQARQEGTVLPAARLFLAAPAKDLDVWKEVGEETMALALGVAEVVLLKDEGEGKVWVEPTGYARCQRCWRYLPEVAESPNGLCQRCQKVLEELRPS